MGGADTLNLEGTSTRNKAANNVVIINANVSVVEYDVP